jgi:hypothetical protein
MPRFALVQIILQQTIGPSRSFACLQALPCHTRQIGLVTCPNQLQFKMTTHSKADHSAPEMFSSPSLA